MSPTARTLAALREAGWIAEVVERRLPIPGKFITQDFAGCIDIIAFAPDFGILGVQACAGASHAARVDKIHAEPRARDWIVAGALLQVWSWALQGPQGVRKRWTPRVQTIQSGDIVPTVPALDTTAPLTTGR